MRSTVAIDAHADADVPLTPSSACEWVATRALLPTPVGRVGLELEGHSVDLLGSGARPSWDRIEELRGRLSSLPAASQVSIEPGGQLEVSTTPFPDSHAAIDALRRDHATARAVLAEFGLGVALVGADPVRPAVRVNPHSRYVAMESYFAITGNAHSGPAMMCSTASLQVNLDAGPAAGWSDRIQLAHRLGPVLVAVSACSPMLRGRMTGWRSTRQRVWGELDRARCGPLLSGVDPELEWARYALQAPVMMIRNSAGRPALPVSSAVPFAAWVAGEVDLAGRRPTWRDLDYHLSTLFPPVRLRGYVEIRYLDAVPEQWWPALAAITVALLDDPRAADAAAAATEPVAGWWTRAARAGLADPDLARAARRCLEAAVPVVPPALKPEVERYAELVESGRSPGDGLAKRLMRADPATVLMEVARA
jgi:glutamate--cysteine ligase